MKWIAGGIAYACAFLYVASTAIGVLLALVSHLLVLALLTLVGLAGFKLLMGDDEDDKDEDTS